ncbi:MAG: hypothetical protein AAFX94_11150 [Myxococcota bacterium]
MVRLVVVAVVLAVTAPAFAAAPPSSVVVRPDSEYLASFMRDRAERRRHRLVTLEDAKRRLAFIRAATPNERRMWQRTLRMVADGEPATAARLDEPAPTTASN